LPLSLSNSFFNLILKIQLRIGLEVIRDNDFIKEIASYLKDRNCVVYLEGSVLSHPYYILISEGVQVRCLNPLEASFRTKEFYKLVRDKIPFHIISKNEQVNSEKLSPTELLEFLKIKIVEEALELYWEERNDSIIEEMADVYEVLLGLCKIYGIDFQVVNDIAKRKRGQRGGFEEGVFLIATKENSLLKFDESDNELFVRTSIDKSLRKRSINRPFKKGLIEKLRTLNELDNVSIPYIHPTKQKNDPIRFLIKQAAGQLMNIRYYEDEIKIEFTDFDLTDPDQMDLFMD